MRRYAAIILGLALAACTASVTEPEATTSSSPSSTVTTTTTGPETTTVPATATTDPETEASDALVLALAEDFIDAFYSWDPDALRILPWSENAYLGSIAYYQGWAEAGNYQIIERHPCQRTASGARCAVQVEDDLLLALGLDFHATDTFHLRIEAGEITGVETSSDDPVLVGAAFTWLEEHQPDLEHGPCEGAFQGGPTPDECVRATVEGFKAYAATRDASG